MDVHCFQMGGMSYIERGIVEPFGGVTLGAAWMKAYARLDNSGNTGSVTRFAIIIII